MSLSFQPMMESRPIREIAYEVLKRPLSPVKFLPVSGSSKRITPIVSTFPAPR